ncbi:MAG TPA: carboxylesterase/lipase family protein [Steroidobacter sp.]|uniref:carboxylesterase/lipase family protein n=1 Tax=Steroidobacter sp. TaxID=1978227 RepID=UPI002EDA2366
MRSLCNGMYAALRRVVMLLVMTAGPALAQAPVVALDSGKVRGAIQDGTAVFKGIPYAAPPLKELRWRAPQPVPRWKGVRPADRWAPECMQEPMPGDLAPASEPMSEDCLTLNVWSTALGKSKQPVLVWIHGGAFVGGSASRELYDGTNLAQLGVVVVTFNYRLGRFGFFAHPALTPAVPDEPIGNYGFMDQIAALRWIQANIAAFGGDPAQVTVFGESAGGASVNMLMTSPAAKGLFHRAIVQSGGGRDRYAKVSEPLADGTPSAQARGIAFAKSVGANDAASLRALPAERLVDGLNMMSLEHDRYSGPMLDGVILPKDMVEAFTQGEQQKIPYLIGTTNREAEAIKMSLPQAEKNIGLLQAVLPNILEHYGDEPDEDRVGIATLAGSDWTFVEPARYLARQTVRSGQPTYLYRFSYVAEGYRALLKGAPHATDVPYVFGTWDRTQYKMAPADNEMSSLIRQYWVNFAKSGDPNGSGLPAWPPYTAADDALLEFDRTGGATTRVNLHRQRLDYIATAPK